MHKGLLSDTVADRLWWVGVTELDGVAGLGFGSAGSTCSRRSARRRVSLAAVAGGAHPHLRQQLRSAHPRRSRRRVPGGPRCVCRCRFIRVPPTTGPGTPGRRPATLGSRTERDQAAGPRTSAPAASRGLVRLGCQPVPVVVPRVATLIRVRDPNELPPVREPGAARSSRAGESRSHPLGGDFGVEGWVSV